jgi:predicted AAA+ superfamily ATPase
MIYRFLQNTLQKDADKYPVVSISGPRQSGKTTLVKEVYKDYRYFNLENPDTRAYAEQDPKGFLAEATEMIIDEVQRVPELFSYIQVIVDEDKNRKFILTGSQNFLISERTSQSLAGRVISFRLLPLSLGELRDSDYFEVDLLNVLFKGLYPRIYDRELDAQRWYDEYIQTYLERDVREIKEIGSLSDFQRFMTLLAGRTAQILNISSLANDVGLSPPTISSWISILEQSYIIHKLPPYYSNISKRLIKSPKIIFVDPGLVCALLGINSAEQLKTHPLVGNIFETFVVSEYRKKFINTDRVQLMYFREKNGNEVDLIFEKDQENHLVEIKYGATYQEKFSKSLYYVENLLQKSFNKVVVYGGNETQNRSDLQVLPWSLL